MEYIFKKEKILDDSIFVLVWFGPKHNRNAKTLPLFLHVQTDPICSQCINSFSQK